MKNLDLSKYEEWLERQSAETAEEIVCEYFSGELSIELSMGQIQEVVNFWEYMNEYSPLFECFGQVIYYWQIEHHKELM